MRMAVMKAILVAAALGAALAPVRAEVRILSSPADRSAPSSICSIASVNPVSAS